MLVSHEMYSQKVKSVNPNVTLLGKYAGSKKPIKVRCACGNVWEPRADRLLIANAKCPSCARKISAAHGCKLDEQSFKQKLKEVAPEITLIGTYVNTRTRTEFMCEHGHKFTTKPGHILYDGTRCDACDKIRRTKDHDDFVKEVSKILPDYKVIGTYRNKETPIEMRCPNGHSFSARPKNLLQGYGCAQCANESHRLTQHEFAHKLSQTEVSLIPLDSYEGYGSPMHVQCKICGHEFVTTPKRLLEAKSTGCPVCEAEALKKRSSKACEDDYGNHFDSITEMCNHYNVSVELFKMRKARGLSQQDALECPKNMSAGEYKIAAILKKRGVEFIQDKSISSVSASLDTYYQRLVDNYNEFLTNQGNINVDTVSPFRYDFVIISDSQIKAFIEFDGEQHFKRNDHFIKTDGDFVKRHMADLLKSDFAKESRVPLLRIRYDQIDKIEELLIDILDNPAYYLTQRNRLLSSQEYWSPYEESVQKLNTINTYSVD